jgi:predicted kinase
VRRVVIVSGAPGAGKSTLAAPLAAELNLPLLSKDTIKERLADSLGEHPDPDAWSKTLGGAAMELIWTLAAQAPAVVLEANFRPHSAYERQKLADLGGRLVEVYCRCPPTEAQRRYAQRARQPGRHPIHVLHDLSSELLAEFDGPLGLGPVIEVDTTASVDVDGLAARVRALLDDEPPPPG